MHHHIGTKFNNLIVTKSKENENYIVFVFGQLLQCAVSILAFNMKFNLLA